MHRRLSSTYNLGLDVEALRKDILNHPDDHRLASNINDRFWLQEPDISEASTVAGHRYENRDVDIRCLFD